MALTYNAEAHIRGAKETVAFTVVVNNEGQLEKKLRDTVNDGIIIAGANAGEFTFYPGSEVTFVELAEVVTP